MANCGRGCGADAGVAVGILRGVAADERRLLSESGWARAAAAGGGVRLDCELVPERPGIVCDAQSPA